MSRIAILYFSGVGNTKSIAEYIHRIISRSIEADVFSVEELTEDFSWERYSAAVIGTPTYHSEPAQPLMSFLESTAPEKSIHAFLFATCGMYPENCLRTLARKCLQRKIVPIAHASYRCSATDGILLMPEMKLWHEHEKNLPEKIKADTDEFLRRLSNGAKRDMPCYKWYAPLNYPNRLMGRAVPLPVHLHADACVGCGKCAADCPRSAVIIKDGRPEINRKQCINCYRCVHHCPALALSLSRRKRVKRVWRQTL